MTQTLGRYHQRAPRYILLPQDNCLIRVAGPKQVPWEEGTEIRNISTSGIAFTAPMYLAPQNGEMIKVQFQVPGSTQMATHALVTRVDNIGEETVLVAAEFENNQMAQQIVLNQGVAKKVRQQQKTQSIEELRKLPIWFLIKISIVTSLFFSSLLLFTIYRFVSKYSWAEMAHWLMQWF